MTQTAERSPRLAEIVEVAMTILEKEGRGGLTMRNLAERLGIRAASLYKHVEDKDELEALLQAEALLGMGEVLHEAVEELATREPRKNRIAALGRAYRAWALEHPHLYRVATGGPLRRERLPEGLEAWAAQPLVVAAGSADRARATWAFAHGMTILELDGRFPPGADLEAAWEQGVTALG